MPISVNITPEAGGQAFEVRNVQSCNFGVARDVAPDGRLGMANHDIDLIFLERERNLQGGEAAADTEEEIIALSAGLANEAYCSGEIEVTRPGDPNTPVIRVTWDSGHVCRLTNSIRGDSIIESINIAVTGLNWNNSEFERAQR